MASNHYHSPRRRVSHLAMLVVLSAAPMAAAPALAGDRTVTADGEWSPTAASGQTETLPTVSVQGEVAPANNQKAATGLDRLPQEIQDTPQTIHVINEQTLQQQGVSSLEQALRNVPGVTVEIGEGGAMNGDQFRIRGLDAQNDIYSDGLKDFGVYTRDTWNMESVQVFLGPSGESFGRGTFGGAINTSSKTPVLDNFITLRGELGTGPHLRTIGDVNYKIGETTAIRLVGMFTDQEIVGRDGPESERWGIAPSIAFGLGTDTTLSVAYFHQEDNRVPDYGIPVAPKSVTGGIASPESGPAPVDRENWYGTDVDRDDTVADVFTVRAAHDANEWLRVTNDTRVGFYSRDFQPTAPSCSVGTVPAGSPPGTVMPGSCVANLLDGDPTTVPIANRGGPSTPTYTDQWGAQNITTGIADFTVGGFKNQFVGGLDVSYEFAQRVTSSNIGVARPGPVDMLNPEPPVWDGAVFIAATERETDATNVALFASEQFWITPELSVLAGLRYDKFRLDTQLRPIGSNTTAPADFEVSEDILSPKASVIWEPNQDQTYYFSWAKSAQPATGFSVGNTTNPVTDTQLALKPTTSETFEVGGKINLLDGKLGLSGAIFQVERDNAKETDESGVTTAAGQQIRNRGVELSVTGQITDAWTIQASYAFIDSEYLNFSTDNSINAVIEGREVNNTPRNSFNIWTTYDVLDNLSIGGGVRYKDEMYVNQGTRGTAPNLTLTTTEVPYYLAVDAVVQYEISRGVIVQVNGYNLFDRDDNYDQTRTNRLVPAAGRTVIFSTQATF